MNKMISYYICSFTLERFELCKSAYTPLHYAGEIEYDVEYFRSLEDGLPEDSFQCIYNKDIDLWKYRVMQRYGSYIKRVIDYIIFGLSYHHIIPDIGCLYLCQEVEIPAWSNYYQIAHSYDEVYPDFCRKYITQLFLEAGWTIELWEGEYLKTKCNFIAERYEPEDDDYLEAWSWEAVEYSGIDEFFYVFMSQDNFSKNEMVSIFCDFCESGTLYRVDSKTVVISVPRYGRENGLEIENNWSVICPFSALAAWTLYCKKRTYGRLVLEANYDRG